MTANPLLELVGFLSIAEVSRRQTLAGLPMSEALIRGSQSRISFLFQHAVFSMIAALVFGVMIFGGTMVYGPWPSFAWYFVPVVLAVAIGVAIGSYQHWANPQPLPSASQSAPQPMPVAPVVATDPEDDCYDDD